MGGGGGVVGKYKLGGEYICLNICTLIGESGQ